MDRDTEKLIHRLNRVIGQIEGIRERARLERDTDCIEVLQQLKASINGLKKFGEAYVQDNMQRGLRQHKKSSAEIEDQLTQVISSAFSL